MSEARDLLQAIVDWHKDKKSSTTDFNYLVEDIEAYLAKPEPEPVAWDMWTDDCTETDIKNRHYMMLSTYEPTAYDKRIPLYAEPPTRKPPSDTEQNAFRYEKVRKMTPREFTDIYKRNLAGEGRFDDLVDRFVRDVETRQ